MMRLCTEPIWELSVRGNLKGIVFIFPPSESVKASDPETELFPPATMKSFVSAGYLQGGDLLMKLTRGSEEVREEVTT